MTGHHFSPAAGKLPLRLMLLITTHDVGGAERVYSEIAQGMRQRGYEVVAACLQSRSGEIGALLAKSGVEILNLGARAPWDPRPWYRLTRVLKHRQTDVIVTFLFHANLVGRVAARFAHTPVVLGCQQSMRFGTIWQLWLNRLTARWCSTMIGVSEKVSRYLVEELRFPESRVATVYNSVDVDWFDGDGRRIRDRNHPVIGCLARLDPQKDHMTLFHATTLILRRHPGLRVMLAGDGPKREKLERAVQQLGLCDHVKFVGYLSDVRPLLSSLDLIVLPSWAEGLPVSVMEGMAMRLPVVASDVGGTSEAVLHEVTGILVPPGQPEPLAEAVCRLLDNPELAREMGHRGRERVEQLFSTRTMLDSLEQLIQEQFAKACREDVAPTRQCPRP